MSGKMELSLLLMKKILSMAIMVVAGYAAVRKNVLKEADTQLMSALSLYIVCPCMILSAFRMEFTADRALKLVYCIVAATVVHFIFIAATWVLARGGHIDPVQQDSVIYANCGNLIIPIIGSLLGAEALFYACAFIAVQTVFLWTHCMYTLGGKAAVDVKKILTNPNIIAIVLGILLFITGLTFPSPVNDAVDALGSMLGPLGMLIAGIVMANIDLREVSADRDSYLICVLRLLVYPLLLVLILKLSGLTRILPDSAQLFMVTFLGAIGPSASTVTQMAKLNDCDYQTASVINVMSIIFCMITMPAMIFIYQLALY